MPFYEYRCTNCGQPNNLFKPTIAEALAAEALLVCRRCGSPALKRRLSRFSLGQVAPTEGEELYEVDRLSEGLGDD